MAQLTSNSDYIVVGGGSAGFVLAARLPVAWSCAASIGLSRDVSSTLGRATASGTATLGFLVQRLRVERGAARMQGEGAGIGCPVNAFK